MRHLLTSESVGEGHPDKVCDQISDAILDACLLQDPDSHVACETLCTKDRVVLAGELRTKASIDAKQIVKDAVRSIGYEHPGFDWRTLQLENYLHGQSEDIALGVDKDTSKSGEQGAGDQGMMYGYAEGDASTEFMPMPIYYAHRVMAEFAKYRKETSAGRFYLRPDAKCQLTFDIDGETPVLDTAVVSHQHVEEATEDILRQIANEILRKAVPAELFGENTRLLVNPTGRFVLGGPEGDTGVTGRKIVVDTYGGIGRVGGGAFSGKDPSKVDRSAAYFCRHAAKHLVKSGMCRKCEVSVAYAIGIARPVAVAVDSFGTGDDEMLADYLNAHFDFRPAAIVERLRLKRPNGWGYRETARNGHFGHIDFPWEKDAEV